MIKNNLFVIFFRVKMIFKSRAIEAARVSHKVIHIFKIIQIVLHIAYDTSQALTYILTGML